VPLFRLAVEAGDRGARQELGAARASAHDRPLCGFGVQGRERATQRELVVAEQGAVAKDGRGAQPGGAAPHDQHGFVAGRAWALAETLVAKPALAADVTCEGLHQRRDAAHARQQAMVVDAAREEVVGRAQQVDLTAAQHVLRLHALAPANRALAGHHVGNAVNAHQAALAGAAQTVGAARAVQLRAARQRVSGSHQQRQDERLAALGFYAPAVVRDGHRIVGRGQALGHEAARMIQSLCP
jgi:hypothetical protein